MNKKHFYPIVILLTSLATGIQPAVATIVLSSSGWDPDVGDWDSGTLTGTLTQNVDQTIMITGNGITLDGGGYAVSGVTSGSGVDVSGRLNVTIQNLEITGSYSGIGLSDSSHITLENNNIHDNNGTGIWILSNCYDNTVRNNTVSTNHTGISLGGNTDGNVIYNNTVSDNTFKGIYLCSNAENNDIYNNNFIENATNADNQNNTNVFNMAAPIGGNYWKDLMGIWSVPGPDENGDGFVDIPPAPYVFTGVGQDNLPWAIQNGWLNQAPVADAGPDQIVEQDSSTGASVTLDGSGSSDPDGDPLTYTWTWSGGSSSTGVNPTVILPLGTTTVTLTVYDGQLSDTDTVDITVQSAESPAEALEYIRDYIEEMDVPEDAEKEMDKAVKDLNKAIDAFDDDRIDKALNEIAKAVKQLTKAQKEGADTQDVIEELVALAQGIAYTAIEDAIGTVGTDNRHVVKAQEHYETALGNLADGKYDAAIKKFKNVYREAMKALGQ